ncbi:pyrroline-5-carboxylate reductase [Oikeobacillus pervagus]|uniref:Pyrroline-5-carboxylate reductase n=1 Tax=Oikeobacillus pervagus TaxID=1325931 RepID=A0AAJ1WHM8_9BACI|nr:pyrroline-5-carboxylate reductase [Oikeobacillus pervagus]MDQ0213780.1 pyrroline-5-carboxylate reductase [Oikeobacillus pervagus]
MKTAFIGAGSMAEAIITGALVNGALQKEEIVVTNHSNQKRLQELTEKYKVNTSYDHETIFQGAKVIVLAMKPKDVKEALQTIQSYVTSDTLIISVLAGVPMEFIESELKQQVAVVRAMPNTSAMIGKSATGISLNSAVTEQQKELALQLFSAIGLTVIVEEHLLDAVTGISGSGPAFIYYVVEAMESSAEILGLEKDLAKKLIIQTLTGAAGMIETSGAKTEELRKAVTSPGGTTEAGLNVLNKHNVKNAFIECITEATAQSKRLGSRFQKQEMKK